MSSIRLQRNAMHGKRYARRRAETRENLCDRLARNISHRHAPHFTVGRVGLRDVVRLPGLVEQRQRRSQPCASRSSRHSPTPPSRPSSRVSRISEIDRAATSPTWVRSAGGMDASTSSAAAVDRIGAARALGTISRGTPGGGGSIAKSTRSASIRWVPCGRVEEHRRRPLDDRDPHGGREYPLHARAARPSGSSATRCAAASVSTRSSGCPGGMSSARQHLILGDRRPAHRLDRAHRQQRGEPGERQHAGEDDARAHPRRTAESADPTGQPTRSSRPRALIGGLRFTARTAAGPAARRGSGCRASSHRPRPW